MGQYAPTARMTDNNMENISFLYAVLKYLTILALAGDFRHRNVTVSG